MVVTGLETGDRKNRNYRTDDFRNQKLSHADHNYISKEKGQIVLDQIRTMDKSRLIKNLGSISSSAEEKVLSVLQEMFAP